MCRTDGEYADAYSVYKPIARKEHKCGECRRVILAGERYERHSMVHEGTASDHIICSHCAVLSAWIGIQCNGTVCGELIEDIEEHALEYERTDLRDLAIAARAQWCWPEASRMNGYRGRPIPAMPAPIELS